ncbi:MAG TPA: hypothetical protein VFZ42_13915 [Chitinophagaceae bacterium]
MKKILLPVLLAFLCPNLLLAQAHEGNVEYDKKKQPAFIIDYAYPPEAVENALFQKLEKLGYRGKEEKGVFNKDKGFRIFKGAYITEISDKSLDFIIKIEPKSRKENDAATLYMIINKDGQNAMGGFDSDDKKKAKEFLNELLPHVESAHLELQIKEQEETVGKSEKKLKALQDEKKLLEEKLKKLDEDILLNEQEVGTLKQALDTLKSRRKV